MSRNQDPLRSYVVHFTRGNDSESAAAARRRGPSDKSLPATLRWLDESDDSGYKTSLSILWDGQVRPTTYAMGIASDVPEVAPSHRSACFSATRLDKLARLIASRSVHGLGFTKDVVTAEGGRPVEYLDSGSTVANDLREEIDARRRLGVDPADPFWGNTPFIEASRNGAWEEEWRVPGGFKFDPDDVAFVFLPAELHDRARTFRWPSTESREPSTDSVSRTTAHERTDASVAGRGLAPSINGTKPDGVAQQTHRIRDAVSIGDLQQ